ncbi:hypothetical protein [Lactobacillus hominis]|uniref:Uncharacterized protein n=1 Tax=Lactobacillus hominis DSM 23910 = CRBIP 24.179 TaxID=1423758 RepID=I7KHX7_9LACO|nr:hypothetical protein [Lactobacillus hominis]KRM85135.1 hypothetical protein FC41_GL001514 [Lactobacillus hominis DSM 23910 = CRBIP 24.179]MCT3348295.1 hypothetical protein [Lactobacillus hominis]CCI82495.1 Putative uncharacterized protein [Lactobacillus hominis DSM 23910 = CRBIP 24.179]
MKVRTLFPVIYGVISALIGFIAALFICLRTFKLNLTVSVGIAAIFAIFFYVLSYFRGHASYEIKRIAAKYHLTDQELAQITGMQASDFPIYNNKLQLIIPKRHWAKVLYQLQEYDKKQTELKNKEGRRQQ